MPETITAAVPMSFEYKNRSGQFIERFIRALGQKKILGVKCPKCRKVYVPPRSACGRCFSPLEKLVEVGQVGVLKNFTIGHVSLAEGEVKPAPAPYILGAIKLADADSLLTAVVTGVDPAAVKPGLKVRAVWKEPPEESYSSLDHFEVVPAGARRPKKRAR